MISLLLHAVQTLQVIQGMKKYIYFLLFCKFKYFNFIFIQQIKGNIHNLRLNNVYKEYFEGNFPYGNVNWLELSYITYENSKIFDENLREKKYFKKYDRDQLQSAF